MRPPKPLPGSEAFGEYKVQQATELKTLVKRSEIAGRICIVAYPIFAVAAIAGFFLASPIEDVGLWLCAVMIAVIALATRLVVVDRTGLFWSEVSLDHEARLARLEGKYDE